MASVVSMGDHVFLNLSIIGLALSLILGGVLAVGIATYGRQLLRRDSVQRQRGIKVIAGSERSETDIE